jgi:hypothetical protein
MLVITRGSHLRCPRFSPRNAAKKRRAGLAGLPDRHVGKVEDQGGRERHGELLGDLAEEISPQKLKMNQQQLGLYMYIIYIYLYINRQKLKS